MRVVIFGNNWVACDILNRFHHYHPEIEIVGVVPEGKDIINRDPSGTWEISFEKHTKRFPYPRYVGNINKLCELFMDVDLFVGCRSAALVKSPVFERAKVGVTNLHFGDLPRYGGCATIQHAILNGESKIGVTFHFMDESLDSGPIIAKDYVKVYDDGYVHDFAVNNAMYTCHGKTAKQIYHEASIRGINLIENNIDRAARGAATPQEGDPIYFTEDMLDFKKDSVLKITDNTTWATMVRHYLVFEFPPLQTAKFEV